MPLEINSVYVSAQDSHGALITDLKRALASNDVSATPSADDAQYRIYISREKQQRRTVSVGNAALAAEYELSLEVDYRIEDAAGTLTVPATTASNVRSYSFDSNAVVAKAEEERLIQQEMRNSIVQQILTRLRFASQAQASGTATVPQPDPDAVREAQQPIEPLTDENNGQTSP